MAVKIGIDKFVTFTDPSMKNKSVYGNALEALVGALFLDRGYKACAEFYTRRILANHVDLEQILATDLNYKSKLIEWAQKEKKSITFEMLGDEPPEAGKLMKIRVLIDSQEMGTGLDYSKKRAEQLAAEIACRTLGLE
jgi:ribonuclease-3